MNIFAVMTKNLVIKPNFKEAYHFGVACEFFIYQVFGIKSSWFGLVAVAIAFVMVAVEQGTLSGIFGMIFGVKRTA